jgi:hypothetical protein
MGNRSAALLTGFGVSLSMLVGCNPAATEGATKTQSHRAGASQTAAIIVPEHPCSFVSASDVAPIVGGPVHEGIEQVGSAGAYCSFKPSTEFTLPGTSAAEGAVTVMGISVSFLSADAFAKTRAQSPFPAQRVKGLGDQAFRLGGIHYAEVLVAKGRYRMAFNTHIGKTEAWEPELELARIVVSRV